MTGRMPSWQQPLPQQQQQQQQQQSHHHHHRTAFGQAVFRPAEILPPPPGFNALETYSANVEAAWSPLHPQQRAAAGFTNAAGRSWSAQYPPSGGLLAFPENYPLHQQQQQQQQQQQRPHRRLPSSVVWPSRVLDMSMHYTDDGSAESEYQTGYSFSVSPSAAAISVSPAASASASAAARTPPLALQPEFLAYSKARRECAPELAHQMKGLAIAAQKRAADRMRSAEFAGSFSPSFPAPAIPSVSSAPSVPSAPSALSAPTAPTIPTLLLPPPQQPPQRAASVVRAAASQLLAPETADQSNSAMFASSPVLGSVDGSTRAAVPTFAIRTRPREGTTRSPVTAAQTTTTTAATTETTAETTTEAGPLVLATSPPGPPAPGFQLPQTGYEFELNHAINLQELEYQQMWARSQLSSCNENARFHHTQTTACIAAVNGRIIGNYTPESMWCYGTNPDLVGLRVTLTMYQGYPPGFQRPGEAGARTDNRSSRESQRHEGATLVLRHQIVVPPRLARITNSNGRGGRSASHGHGHGGSSFAPGHQQNRRRLFATTIVPLRGSVAARPGYRPIEGTEATERMRSWGGNPSSGTFGNAWLLRMATDAGQIEHVIDNRAMEQLSGSNNSNNSSGASNSQGRGQLPMWPEAGECMRMVNENMKMLTQRDGSLSILLSNHATQKRMARQCPDLVAMWLVSQENL